MSSLNFSTGETITDNDGECDVAVMVVLPNYREILQFEKDFDYVPKLDWMMANWTLSFYAVAIYLVLIAVGTRLMRSRPPFDLRWALFLWNLALSLLSIAGALRFIPEMVYIIREFGFSYSLCDLGSFQHGQAVAFWGWLFAWSKLWELGDTAFIVLRKQNLIFLHWYHHVTVLLGTWYGGSHINSMSRWFVAVNYLVHAVMYSYYVLKTLKVRIPKVVSIVITAAQILQMVTCIYVTFKINSLKNNGTHCCTPYKTLYIGMGVYATYFFLFLNYFLRTYVFSSRRSDKALPRKMD